MERLSLGVISREEKDTILHRSLSPEEKALSPGGQHNPPPTQSSITCLGYLQQWPGFRSEGRMCGVERRPEGHFFLPPASQTDPPFSSESLDALWISSVIKEDSALSLAGAFPNPWGLFRGRSPRPSRNISHLCTEILKPHFIPLSGTKQTLLPAAFAPVNTFSIIIAPSFSGWELGEAAAFNRH